MVADRNRHVRDYLRREMRAEGYQLLLAKNSREVLNWIDEERQVDLLILDLDLPDITDLALLKKLKDLRSTLPVVIHTIPSEYINHVPIMSTAAFVEKNGSSIDRLKKVISDILRKSYPGRFEKSVKAYEK